ncbi:MAG: 3-phosphoshikimate 1-carboxyvinyltransferase, partial [Cytophagales bacterium]|nr:3-phosphoshikimate 1-carboxyvinyltransferase [Cytophagales bacterium]
MAGTFRIQRPSQPIDAQIRLSSSKSESNRALIINAITGFKGQLENVSDARDTQTMLRLLSSSDKTLDVLDAGTTMRFLTALKSVLGENRILTGTPRMCERPIGILVNALRELGAEITFLKNDGYPPMEIHGFKYSGKKRVQIKGDVSSQYISALLMVSPLLPEGIELELTGHIASRPYILMTLELMKHFGVNYTFEGQVITVPAQKYVPTTFAIESDWSGASYWYSVVALAGNARVHLLGLKSDSLQGDSAIVKIM